MTLRIGLLSALLLAGSACASLQSGEEERHRSLDGPVEGIALLEAGAYREASLVFGQVIERARRPGQLSLRGSTRALLANPGSGSLAVTDTEEALLLLFHGSALTWAGQDEKAATRARMTLERHADLPDDLRCWAFHLLMAADAHASRRQASPSNCPDWAGDFRLRLQGEQGELKRRVESERASSMRDLVTDLGRLALAVNGVPTPSRAEWVPGNVAIEPLPP